MNMPSHYRLRTLGDVDSTNAEAVRILQTHDDPPPTWITASSQNSGRGRRGRTWNSPPGNLYATLLFRPHVSANIAPQLSLVASLAVRDMAASFLQHGGGVTLKWPNDVLLDEKKLAGILLETHQSDNNGGNVGWIAIGIGVNLIHFPLDSPYPATSLQQYCGKHPEPPEALDTLAWSMDARLSGWNKGEGFERFRNEWTEHAYGIGEEVRVGLGGNNNEMRGTFLGLDNNGALRLRHEQGEQSLQAADVRFLRTRKLEQQRASHAG